MLLGEGVGGGQEERERDYFNKNNKQTAPLASHRILSELARQKENKDMTNPKGCFAEEQRSLKC